MNKYFVICDFETTGINTDTDYSIEIGIILTDEKFNVLETYNKLIKDQDMIGKNNITNNEYCWNQKYIPAYNVHKIELKEIIENGIPPEMIRSDIMDMIHKYKHNTKDKFILLSDNIQFEFNFMSKLFKESIHGFPFHYCGWDSSLLLEVVTDVGDPKNVPHRALPDAFRLYKNLIRALDRTGTFQSN